MKRTLSLPAVALLATLAPLAAEATAVVFDNGTPNLQQAHLSDYTVPGDSVGYRVAEDFTVPVLGTPLAHAVQLRWWGVYSLGDGVPGSDAFQIYVFDNLNGEPWGNTLLSQYAVGAEVQRVATGQTLDVAGHPMVYEYTVTLPGTMLTQGQYYWLTIQANTQDDDDSWFWASASNGGAYSQQQHGNDSPWSTLTDEMAFQLTFADTPALPPEGEPGGGNVPEPASWALAATALAALRVVRRRA